MIKNKFKIVAATVAVLFAASCSQNADNTAEQKPLVCVSLEPQRWILDQIAGDKIEVVSFLPGDANPENFDPPVSTLRQASEAAAYMRMGHLPWENSLIEKVKATNPKAVIVDTSEGIDLIEGSHGHSHDDGEMEYDPHTWSSVKNAKTIAANMLKSLESIDSVNAPYYRANYSRLAERLDSLDNAFTARLENHKGEPVLVWHPSLSYFARDYGLNQIAIGAENKETTLQSMQRKIDMATSNKAKVFFVQPQMDGSRSEQIVNLTGAKKVVVHPLDYNWIAQMELLTDALTDSIAQ